MRGAGAGGGASVLIVFDLDGTLADSRELARISFKRVFALMGCGEITDEQADSFNGPDADEICRVMGIGPDRRGMYDCLVDETDVELVRSIGRMFPGTEDMLMALAPWARLSIPDKRHRTILRGMHGCIRASRRISACTAALSAG